MPYDPMHNLEEPARRIVDALRLEPHPEGGFYRETYRSPIAAPAEVLPPGYPDSRSLCTVILFLLPSGKISRFHRLRSDEIWFHHTGDPIRLHLLSENAEEDLPRHLSYVLGPDLTREERPQALVPAGCWMAAEPAGNTHGFGLVGCLVSPGFEFADFELGRRDLLEGKFPGYRELVHRFT